MYLGGVINPLTLTIKRLIAAIPKIIKIIPAAFLIIVTYLTALYLHKNTCQYLILDKNVVTCSVRGLKDDDISRKSIYGFSGERQGY